MLLRPLLEQALARALGRSRAVVLAGPRQVGKTTLARKWLPTDSANYFDLETIDGAARLAQPQDTLRALQGLVVIDEVQKAPELFAVLRALIDRSDAPGQYLLLGSASPAWLRQTSESLLGRVEVIEVSGFNLDEVGAGAQGALWLRGGYPRSFLATDEANSFNWRNEAVNRYVEQDLRQLGIDIAPPAMLRFWKMLAHYHGQIWSAAPFAQSMGVSQPTVRKYMDILTYTYMIRQLQPWHQNLGKRQVKAPKIYFRDTGVLHALMGIKTVADLVTHPNSGASWEGFALEQVLRIAKPDEAFFWATHQGAELDLLMFKGQQRIGVEFKRADAPKVTQSMRIAMHDLKLDALYVVYPGMHRYPMGEGVEAVPLWAVLPGPHESPALRGRFARRVEEPVAVDRLGHRTKVQASCDDPHPAIPDKDWQDIRDMKIAARKALAGD